MAFLLFDVGKIVKLALEYPKVVVPAKVDDQPTGLLEEHSAHAINGSQRFLRIAAEVRELGSYSFIAHAFVTLIIDWAKATNTTVLFINLQPAKDGGYQGVSRCALFFHDYSLIEASTMTDHIVSICY